MPKSTSSDKICIGQYIRRYREQNGVSLKQFSEALSISPQAVSKWEHGISYPDITLIPDIAKLIGVSVANLFGEEAPSSDREYWFVYIVRHR